MDRYNPLLEAGFDPVFVFSLQDDKKAGELLDLNEAALELMESSRENILLLKDHPEEWFPFLKSFIYKQERKNVVYKGELYTHSDDSVTVEIKPTLFQSETNRYLILIVRRHTEEPSTDSNVYYGTVSRVMESSHFSKLFRALNAAAEKMESEITPEGVFEAVKIQFKKLGFSCSIYLTTPDQQYIYPKYMSYSPLVVKLASKLFGVNPYEFKIPVEKTTFSRNLVFKRRTLFVEDPHKDLTEMVSVFPELKSVSVRIIEWMSHFLKKTISAPLLMNDRVIGALTVHSNSLEEKDKNAISAFAHQVAIAMHKAKLLEDLQRHLDEKEKIEKALRVSEARLKLAFEAANDAIWDYSFQTNQLYLGPRWFSMMGYRPGEIKPDMKTIFALIHPDDREYIRDTYAKCIKNPNRRFSVEYRIRNKQGEWLFMRSKAKFVDQNEDGKPTRFVGISSDITDQKIAEDNLIHLAFHDTLTGLMNRKAFLEKSDEILTALKRKNDNKLTAYLYIDLDHFKDINDTFGHNVGDDCLKQASKRLLGNIRESDQLFRLGGDEFILILTELKHPTDASLVAEKLIKVFSEPFIWNNNPLYLQLSIGIALYPKDGMETWQLLSNSDTALYKAKSERNTYRFYDEQMQIEAIQKITIINDIRTALANSDFQIYYQPILTCDGKPVAAEALIRWFDDEGNMIPPDRFIPWAEESGLIIPLGFKVLSMVVEDMAEWKLAGINQIPVSINISAKQLKQQELIPTMEKIIQSKSLDPNLFHLEITETSLMENLDDILEKLDILKKSGLKFSIDDFGTGYSSLSYLKKLPIDILKIDKSFIAGLPNNQDSVIVRAIISLAQQLELKVIAEGVETQPQFEFLNQNGKPLIQGFFFCKPLPKNEFTKFISRNSHFN